MKKKVPEYIAIKAEKIIEQLNTTGFTGIHKKRLSSNRDIISIPLGTKYRIIVKNDGVKFICSEVLTHAAYSIKIKSRRH